MYAARAPDLRASLQLGFVNGAVRDCLREVVAGLCPDRFLSPELEAAAVFVNEVRILN